RPRGSICRLLPWVELVKFRMTMIVTMTEANTHGQVVKWETCMPLAPADIIDIQKHDPTISPNPGSHRQIVTFKRKLEFR
ncbi:hypothetical protein KEH51_29665, partial [[Brevibacterium] frigoritolerans]|nr:hypothetical protein [Peribacillus frigoritolerans]